MHDAVMNGYVLTVSSIIQIPIIHFQVTCCGMHRKIVMGPQLLSQLADYVHMQ